MENTHNLKKTLLRVGSYVLVAALASAATLAVFGGESKLEELERVLQANFVGDTDTTVMEDAAASAMVTALGDRWSYYVPASAYESYQEGKTNSYVGIGITVMLREDGNGFDITRVEPGSSAQEAGIQPGDVLVEAQGQSLVGMDINGPAQYIKGEAGSEVTVTVLRGEETLHFTVVRQTINTQVARGEMLDGNIGYVKIANFNDRCAEQTIALTQELVEQGAVALIFDVRDNPGGYRTELVEILDYLLPEGPLFRSVSSSGVESTDRSDAACLELPMSVLVNGDSYSAAEFFAAALSEYDWATVVGTPTCGKGYYQNTFKLSDGSAVGLSVGAYYTPNGVSLAEEGGLIPDVEVAVDEETAARIYADLVKPMDDPQILAAIQALSGTLE